METELECNSCNKKIGLINRQEKNNSRKNKINLLNSNSSYKSLLKYRMFDN